MALVEPAYISRDYRKTSESAPVELWQRALRQGAPRCCSVSIGTSARQHNLIMLCSAGISIGIPLIPSIGFARNMPAIRHLEALVRKCGWPAQLETPGQNGMARIGRCTETSVQGVYINRAPSERMTLRTALMRYMAEGVATTAKVLSRSAKRSPRSGSATRSTAIAWRRSHCS